MRNMKATFTKLAFSPAPFIRERRDEGREHYFSERTAPTELFSERPRRTSLRTFL